jgi:hypothetical protein
MIYDISPIETPFVSNIGKGKATAVLHEWQTDVLAAAVSTNQQPEGNDITSFAAVTPTVRVGNYAQIMSKEVIVSGTIEVVKKAGRSKELARETAKRLKEIKRDLEKNALENIAASGSDPRKMAGMGAWLKTNISKDAGGADPVYTTLPNDDRTDGTQRAFTETLLKDALTLAWDNGGEPSMLIVGSFNKKAFSAFAGVGDKVFNMNQGRKTQWTIIGASDVYVSDFGVLEVVADRFVRARDAWGIDTGMASIDYLRPFKVEELAKTGDAKKRLVVGELTLKVNNEKAHFLVADLTTS